MSAEIINLPARDGPSDDKGTLPLIMVADQVLQLLRIAERDLTSRRPRKYAMGLLNSAIADLDKAIAGHSAEQVYSIGQMFALAMGTDVTGKAIQGAQRALRVIADALELKKGVTP